MKVSYDGTLPVLSRLGGSEYKGEFGLPSLSVNALVPETEKIYALSHAAFHVLTGQTSFSGPTFEPFVGRRSLMRYWSQPQKEQHKATVYAMEGILDGSFDQGMWDKLQHRLQHNRGKLWAQAAIDKLHRLQSAFAEPEFTDVTASLLERLDDEDDFLFDHLLF